MTAQPSPELPQSGCDTQLPVWGVTRQFDFGQFVILYKEEVVAGRTVSLPLVVAPDATVSDVDTSASGNGSSQGLRGRGGLGASAGDGRLPTDGRPPDGSLAASVGGVPLDLALRAPATIELMTRPPATVPVADLGPVLADGGIEHEGRTLFPLLDDNSRAALAGGETVMVIAETGTDEDPERVALRLVPDRLEIALDDTAIDTALASGEVALPNESRLQLQREQRVDDLLYNARPVRTTARLDSGELKPVRLMPNAPASTQPAAKRFVLEDPARFISDPVVPALDASALQLPLDAETVGLLRKTGRASVSVNGFELELEVATGDEAALMARRRDDQDGLVLPWPDLKPRTEPDELLELGGSWEGWRESYVEPPSGDKESGPGAELAPALRPKGLPVAVLLPWRQRWILEGFSRGNLLSSIALAPNESRTVRVSSWERRAKALEQSTETETQLESDFTSTTRDTEDVFREMTGNREFQAQAHGEVDASYSAGTASIAVNVGGSLAQATNLEQIARSSTTHMHETTRRSSARVRSRRITKISESEESFRGEDVVRQITNGNACHTLTLDYYEKLAHYRVTTQFVPERVKVVVLVDNPLGDTRFDSLSVRTNETALKQALINPELADAFAASRLLASYTHAWTEAEHVATRSKEVAELDRERVKQTDGPAPPTKPDNPHTARLLSVLGEIRTAAGPVLSAHFKRAIDEIADHRRPVETANRQSAQRWLWRRLVEVKMGPGFINKLQALAAKPGQLTPDDARTFADAIPGTTYPSLTDLGGLKDTEKEDAALSMAIRSRMIMPWDWAWWSGSCREEGLYQPDDNGITGACARLVTALREYETKASEGDALLAQQELVNKAGDEQAAANWVDKLEFKYGIDVVADAREREEALLAHLDANADYYRYVLFQALPPSEQQARLLTAAPQLKVGFFEPRVVAYYGRQLAVPVSPTGQTELATLIADIGEKLKQAADEANAASEQMDDEGIILPTPGLTIETSLGSCSACGPHEQAMREITGRYAEAEAKLVESEARRRKMRLDANDLGPFTPSAAPLNVDVTVEDGDGPNKPDTPDPDKPKPKPKARPS